ncbi:MAG: hypothetical protein M1371_04070 [Actinobacteria bacterium]|nr:hypothetical protein [Actinomycetota bacterium]MCL5985725.1 hypothetical protein [Actinomycetota bacterium]
MSNHNLFDENPRVDIIIQGDIYPEIDFYIFNNFSYSKNPHINSIAHREKRLAVVISQTCDIFDSDNLFICPIFTLNEYINSESNINKAKSNVGLIKSRKGLLEKFFLGNLNVQRENYTTYDEFYIDLKIINTIDKSLLNPIEKIACLSDWGRHHLCHQLSWLFGRPVANWT